ncbi:MAG: TIGR03905 family TSCPD domain-containing protein [Firmicutes bacterium]|uniref:ribonucleoside-diphosphate reductase n=1 Tax=Candidatus Scatoplasma merdavium TaxID=2840932 RepID=A0A9D9GRB9_9BACL|nr:TIGR03905 family TSCPD domain-containing protein [Candidatus Scatoplasma merdavium]
MCKYDNKDLAASFFYSENQTRRKEEKRVKKYEYKTKMTCSYKIDISYDEKTHEIIEVNFFGGCPGNTTGVSKLVKGRSLEEVAELLKGIPCRSKPTSCPDQLACACEEILASLN